MTGASPAAASAEVISLADERASIRRRLLQRSAREVGEKAFARADHYDEDGAYPSVDISALHDLGLLTAVLPIECGGAGLSELSLSEILRSIGSGSLPLGRLFEGHVNALELVLRYGNHDQVELVAEEAQAGKLFGVWNTEDSNGLRLIHSWATLARRPKDPGLGRRTHRTPARNRDRRRRASIDGSAQAERFRAR